MKRLDRYILGSMVRIIGTSVLLITTILLLFDIFSHIEQYMNHGTSYRQIGLLTVLFIPQAIGYALGPACLFATTYFLAMLHANNEMIILSNIGHPFRRIIIPILTLGVVITILSFVFNENVAIPASKEKQIITDELFGTRTTQDSRNVTLRSPEGDYVLFAGRYLEETKTISNVILVVLDETGRIVAKVDAVSGTFNGSYWVLHDAVRYLIDPDGGMLEAMREEDYHNRMITMDPALFRNLSADISSMELTSAIQYVQRIQVMNASQYATYATELFQRIFGNLTPLILMVISCSTVFTWRKNVLILSILASLAIAVVFFVMQMISMIIAKQGVIPPVWGSLAPMGALVLLSSVIMLTKRI